MESDPVVAEIPVFHSKALERLLHVFCFPLRTSDRPYESANVELEVADTPNAYPPHGSRWERGGKGGKDDNSDKDEPGSLSHEPVVSGNHARFSMRMSFSCDGAMQPSFSGKEPAAPAAFAQVNANSAQAHSMQRAAAGAKPGSSRTKQEVKVEVDDSFGTNDTDDYGAARGSGGVQKDNNSIYGYQLDSLPAQQHASYAAALFYEGALHLTKISGIHQFYPRTSVDQLLEAAMVADLNGTAINSQTAQAAAQAQQLLPSRLVPRSLAMSRLSEKRSKLDWIGADQPDAVPIARLLVSPTAEHDAQQQRNSSATATTSGGGVGDEVTNFNIRTAAQLQRSSSDPGRDEDEMMWSLQPFFPFIEGNSFDGTDGSTGGASSSRGGGWANKGHVALKFAHHAMGIDEQVAAVLGMAKIASCADLQRTVLTPDRNVVPAARLVQALRRVAVCIHGVWATLWDPSCSGSAAFIREYAMAKLALSPNGCISARELLAPLELSQPMRKVARNILPLFAELIDDVNNNNTDDGGQESSKDDDADATASTPTLPQQQKRVWRLKHYNNGSNALALARDCPEEAKAQMAGWEIRLPNVMNNVRQLAAGDQLARTQLALRSVATAGMQALRGAVAGGGGQATIAAEDLARARRFVVNAFELHGVINKVIFRERIVSMAKERNSLIFAVPKETLQEALKHEVRSFTDHTWILQRPVDGSTASLRPYVTQAILEKQAFATKEIVSRTVQLVQADPAQTIMPRPTSGTAAAVTAAADGKDAAESKKAPEPPQGSLEVHNVVLKLVNELCVFSRGEKMWHVKTGLVQFLTVA